MATSLAHLGIRLNHDPNNPATDVIATYDFSMDNPCNYNPGRQQIKMTCKDGIESYGSITEVVNSTSPRAVVVKGLGNKITWDITVDWELGNPPTVGNTYENMLGSTEANGWALCNAWGIGQGTTNDGISVYYWLTTNLNWGNPAEAWVRVVPKAAPRMVEGSLKGWSNMLQMSVATAKTYKDTGARTYARRGFTYAGPGTITKNATTAVTGAGGTLFLRDFIKGDYLTSSAGVRYGRVLSVASNTAMTLDIFDTGALAGVAYKTQQRSNNSFSVPIYAFTVFSP